MKINNCLQTSLQAEIAHRVCHGNRPLRIKEIESRLRALGYRLDRSLDCMGFARYMTGERAGESYPSITTGIKETDTGRSAFHFESRRDESYQAMQAMRLQEIYAVHKGCIFEI